MNASIDMDFETLHQRIDELEKSIAQLYDEIEDLVVQACWLDDEDAVDSMAMSIYEYAITMLVDIGRYELIPAGRVIARRKSE